jgi:GTP-binding protein
VVGINKIDLPQVRERLSELRDKFEKLGFDVFEISALAREGLRELLWKAHHILQDMEETRPVEEELPVYRPDTDLDDFAIVREADGSWRIQGKAVERAADMTYWEYDEAVRRFQMLLERLGVEDALQQAGVETGDTVRIGDYELEWVL